MGQLLDRALAAMGNYGNTQGQAEVLAKEFIDGTQGMDAVVKQQALDQSLNQMRQLYGTEVADTAYKLASPTPQERGFTGAARDFYNYGAGMIDNMQAPFIAATYGPDSQRMAANNAEIARNNADLSEAQRLDDYKAAQNMAQAKARGEYGVSAYLQNFGASPFKATTELASSVLPAAGIVLANAGAVALDSTGVFAPIGAAIHVATPAALAAIGAAQSYGGARADLYEKTMAASDADLIANSPQYAQLRNSGMTEQQAKTQIGTNISDHIPEFVGQTLTGALTGGIEGKLMRGLGGGVLSSVLKGQATEGLDEGAQQILSNYAYQNVDPRQALLEDVPLSALQGAILGSAMGGVGGAVNNYNVKNAPQSQVDAALNVQGTAEQQQLGLPSPSVPLQLGYDNPAAGYNTYARNDTPIAMQDLRGQTAIEMGYNPTSYPSKNIYDANTRTGSRDGTILDMQSNEVPVQNAVSNEVIQRIQEAASQAPLTAQQRIENAASGYSNTSPIDTATAYSPRITAQPDYQSVATVSSPAYDYDAEIAKIDNEIENISNPTANLVGKIKALGSINISERSDLLGTRGREAAKLYPALFSKDGQSLHDYIDSGALNDVLPYDLQVNPTDGVPMDTQPAFEYIAEKLKSGDASINMDLEAQAELGNLQRTRDSMIEARNNDVRYVNQQFANNAQNTNNDYAALQSVLPQRDFIPIASQATYSGWNVDAATERLNEVKNLPLTKKQQNALKILTPKYLTELKDVEGIISKWKEQNGRTTARSNDNTIITGLDRSRPKQSNNSGYVDSTSGENQPATGNADTGSVGKPVSGIQFSQADNSNKKNQLDIINKTNPAPNEYSTWVRSTDDILTAQEAFKPAITDGTMYPDFSIDDMNKAIETGKVEVYSSYPIKNGVFVTPSRMNAESYSGDGKIYTKTVSIDDIAWIDEGEGQYAKLNKTEKQSQTDSSPKTGNTVSQIKTTLADALGLQGKLFRERLPMVDVVQSVTDELRAQVGDGQLSVIAWHGTPHTVDKFTTDKIGTGEGAQAYGYGLYFADRRAVAEQYKDALSDGISVEYKGYPTREPSDFSKDKRRPVQKTWDEAYIINKFKDRLNNQQTDDLAIKGIKDEILKEYVQFDRLTHDEIKSILDEITVKKGRLYQVELAPKENEYLLWDKPFSEQSEYVKKSINDYSLLGNKFAQKIQDENLSGQDIQKGFVSDARNRKGTAGKGILNDGAEKEASKTLLYIGIKGIKYLDSSSRSKGEGSYNYVIFSDDDIEIKAQFSRSQLSGAQGFYNPKTKRITLIADNIPVDKELSVFLHEVFHKRGDELLGDKMPQLVSRVTKWKDADVNSIENQIYVAADARAKASGNYDSEFLAYAIEEAVNRGVKIDPNKIGDNSAEGFMAYVYRVFTTAFKKLVPNYKGKFTADDLVSIAYGAANLELKGNDNAIQKQSTSQNEEVTSQSQKDQDAEIVAQYATEDGAPTEAQIREARQQIRDVEDKYSKELADGSWVNLTPTGKRSELTKGQWVQVRTDNFKKWFGDWENDPANASKVVDSETGEPLAVYHGAATGFSTFDERKIGDRDPGFFGAGFYFAPNEGEAQDYADSAADADGADGGEVIPAFLAIQKPFVWDMEEGDGAKATRHALASMGIARSSIRGNSAALSNSDERRKFAAAMKAAGHDGVIVRDEDGILEVVAFRPNKIKSATDNIGGFSSQNDDIRFSRPVELDEITDFSKTGKVKNEDTLFGSKTLGSIKAKDWAGFEENFLSNRDKIQEALEDNLVPVKRWIQKMPISNNMKQSIVGALYRAPNVRNVILDEIDSSFITPMSELIAKLSKKYEKLSPQEIKRIAGYWMDTVYAPTANANLIDKDRAAYNEAVAGGDAGEIAAADRKLRERIAEVNDTDLGRRKFKHGVAGGYTNAQAAQIRKNFEALMDVKDLQEIASHVYGMLKYKLDLDLKSGKITQDQYNEWSKNKNYVPLTGEPQSDIDDVSDLLVGGSLNVQKDKAMGGRTSSIAEDAIDAATRAVNKSAVFAGYKDFKDGINAVYEDAINEKINSGLDAKEAMKEIAQDYGLERSGLMGTTRTSDNVIIHKVNGKDVQFNVPTAVMEAIKGMNVEFAASIFKYPKMLNQWFGRALTQFYPMFAPKNLIMDVGERSEVIRVKDIYDAKGNKVDGNKVANSMLRKSFNPATIKNIAKEIISGKLESQDAKDLKELMDLGGASTFVQGLRDEKSLIDKINSHRNIAKNTKKKLLEVTEKYNDVFSYVPMLAAYQSFKENGVSPKDAASLTLDLTNFGKRGKWMSPVSALFVFAQPTALGAANLSRVLSTRRGQTRAAVYVAIGTALYMTLRALDDEDEGGNKLDQQGDITRNILIPSPINKGEYIKIPLGYGLPQWAWNISVNIARSLVGAQSGVDALSNIAVNNTKSFAPIAPSEIPVSKYPIEKAVMTLSPTLFQPFVQIALNKNAFGTAIKPAFARDDKLKSEQSKSTTAEEWKDAAIWLQRNTGVDMHPEQIKNLYDGYKGFLGPMRDLSTFLIENPNKEAQGKTTSNPILNSFYGSENAYAIQSRYYEAMDEAKQLKAELDSRKKQGDLGDWLTDDVKKKLAWYEQANKEEGKASAVKSKATKSNNKGGMSDAVYAGVVNSVAKSRADIQRRQLNQWRILNGQPTILTK